MDWPKRTCLVAPQIIESLIGNSSKYKTGSLDKIAVKNKAEDAGYWLVQH